MSSWNSFVWDSAPPYQQIYDYQGGTTGQPIYVGWAVPGQSQSNQGWKIRKFTYDANNQILQIQYANGDPGFSATWSQRTSYNYA